MGWVARPLDANPALMATVASTPCVFFKGWLVKLGVMPVL
jgi:hypothetical protein